MGEEVSEQASKLERDCDWEGEGEQRNFADWQVYNFCISVNIL